MSTRRQATRRWSLRRWGLALSCDVSPMLLLLLLVGDWGLSHAHLAPPSSAVYEIKLGTVDEAEVDVEWRLRPYMNTARKRLALGRENQT